MIDEIRILIFIFVGIALAALVTLLISLTL